MPGRSVVIIEGVLAGRSAILLWMRFLGLGFQGTNRNPLLARSIWRILTQSVVRFPPNHSSWVMCSCRQRTRQETATRAETSLRRWWSGAERKTRPCKRTSPGYAVAPLHHPRPEECNSSKNKNSPHAFRGPFKIPLRFLRRFQSLVEAGAHSFQATLSKCLKFEQFLLLRIQVSRSINASR